MRPCQYRIVLIDYEPPCLFKLNVFELSYRSLDTFVCFVFVYDMYQNGVLLSVVLGQPFDLIFVFSDTFVKESLF